MGLLRHKETTIRFLGNSHTSKSCCISEKGISLDEKKKNLRYFKMKKSSFTKYIWLENRLREKCRNNFAISHIKKNLRR